ncbi:MAG: PorP/SprF family type IX secretion system membrane protein [Bacteroidetes bacterium]|nr:PorP/SprF family type IX secretion system membrane protein [Bacteroidota bacterium]
MKTGINKILAGVFVVIGITGYTQDIHFSQFDETPLQLNPANAGVQYETRFIANYKSQWQSVNAPFKTFAVSGDARLLKKKRTNLGIGLDVFSDNAGSGQYKTTQANLSISGIVSINDASRISGGIMLGYAQHSLNRGSYTWGNQYNGLAYDGTMASGEPTASNNFGMLDLGAGVAYTYGSKEQYMTANNAKRITIGVSVFHPNQPAYSYYSNGTKLYMKYVFHGDAALGIKNTNLVLKPSYIIFIQGPAKEITPGMTFQYILQDASKYTGNKKFSAVSVGGYYRAKDAFIAVAKFDFNTYAIGFSYDVNLSKLRTVSSTRGGFEITLRAGFNSARGSGSKAMFK